MQAIYKPKGKALEYSPWALNLWLGCMHACKYCYAPKVLRMKRREFHARGVPRKGILEALDKQLRTPGAVPPGSEILLCFTSDPYQPAEAEHQVTRRALEMLVDAGHQTVILTKNPKLALRDLDIMKRGKTKFGITALFMDEPSRQEWEPGASPLAERFRALAEAYDSGLRTWVSVEPVIYPEQALLVIHHLAQWTDKFKVGKLNHMPELECKIDWAKFLRDAVSLLQGLKKDYYIKRDLHAFGEHA